MCSICSAKVNKLDCAKFILVFWGVSKKTQLFALPATNYVKERGVGTTPDVMY